MRVNFHCPDPTIASTSTSASALMTIMTPNAIPEADLSPLRSLCKNIRRQVDDFLASEPSDEILRATQHQARASIAVIEEALFRYP